MKQWWIVGLGLLLALAMAQSRTDIRLDLKAFRVLSVSEGNRTTERLEAALDVRPGQLIEYQLNAQNTTNNTLRQVALIIPIPSSTTYQALSAQPLRLGETLVTQSSASMEAAPMVTCR